MQGLDERHRLFRFPLSLQCSLRLQAIRPRSVVTGILPGPLVIPESQQRHVRPPSPLGDAQANADPTHAFGLFPCALSATYRFPGLPMVSCRNLTISQ